MEKAIDKMIKDKKVNDEILSICGCCDDEFNCYGYGDKCIKCKKDICCECVLQAYYPDPNSKYPYCYKCQ